MFLMSAPISNGAANIAHITMFVCSSTALSPPQQMQGASGCARSTQYLQQQRPARPPSSTFIIYIEPIRSIAETTQVAV
jgi:hypothetical protein